MFLVSWADKTSKSSFRSPVSFYVLLTLFFSQQNNYFAKRRPIFIHALMTPLNPRFEKRTVSAHHTPRPWAQKKNKTKKKPWRRCCVHTKNNLMKPRLMGGGGDGRSWICKAAASRGNLKEPWEQTSAWTVYRCIDEKYVTYYTHALWLPQNISAAGNYPQIHIILQRQSQCLASGRVCDWSDGTCACAGASFSPASPHVRLELWMCVLERGTPGWASHSVAQAADTHNSLSCCK